MKKKEDVTWKIFSVMQLKICERAKKLTQKQLSELTGYKQNTISNHEKWK